MKMCKNKSAGVTTAALLALAAWVVPSQPAARAQEKDPTPDKALMTVPAITKPSKELKLAFPSLGIIRDVLVKEGDTVKKDQLLMTADDRMDVKQLASLKIDGDSTVNIDAAKAEYANKQVELKRLEQMKVNQVASDLEVERADLDVEIAKLKIRQAEQEHMTKGLDYERQAVKVDLLKLTSPIDGVISKSNISEGEAVDPQNREGAIVVVLNDPLWIEVRDLPTSQATRLKMGDVLKVRYTDAADKEWKDAKVIFFSPVADAASDTLLVRLELPNPSLVSSGLHMEVKLPDSIAASKTNGAEQASSNN